MHETDIGRIVFQVVPKLQSGVAVLRVILQKDVQQILS